MIQVAAKRPDLVQCVVLLDSPIMSPARVGPYEE
jgi:hypothetical protein